MQHVTIPNPEFALKSVDPHISGVWPIELSLSQRSHWVGNYFEDITFSDDLMTLWYDFAESWNDLEEDQFMADGGKYRRRRFSEFVYDKSTDSLQILKHAPFFQSMDLNTLNGGIDRRFAPVTPYIATHPITAAMIRQHAGVFAEVTGHDRWAINFHQVRITALADMTGKPAPEGMHKDGVTYTTLFCIRRDNAEGAENLMYDNEKVPVFSTTLTRPGDIIIFEDDAFYHDVTPMAVDNPNKPAERDMLFIEFTRC